MPTSRPSCTGSGRPSGPSSRLMGVLLSRPYRVAIETTGGVVLDERHDRHSSFAGHVQDTPWDNLHAVYFGSYALWTYLTIPFLFTYPRVAHRND
jgi:hypothetical protein